MEQRNVAIYPNIMCYLVCIYYDKLYQNTIMDVNKTSLNINFDNCQIEWHFGSAIRLYNQLTPTYG